MPPSEVIFARARDCNDVLREGGAVFTADTKTTFANAVDDLADEMAQHNCPDEAAYWHDMADHIRKFT